MDPSAWIINADSTAAAAVIPWWAADAGGVTLSINARVVVRLSEGDQNVAPQLISHFCRRRMSSSYVAAEHVHFTIPQPYYRISHQPAWEEQTRWMFFHVAANHVHPADLDLLAQAFRRYTYAVVDQFPVTELVFVEFFSVVEIPIAPSASASSLRYVSRGPTPASAAAVEGLQMVIAAEDNSCPICLDDFEAMSQVLAMPCGHPFHEGCLMEWLKQSNSCPLCRFSLPAAE